MNIDAAWVFYWLIAAVVATPIVTIVRGITAKKRADEDAREERRPE